MRATATATVVRATATPAPTLTPEQAYTATVKKHTSDDKVTVTYSASDDTLMVQDNIGEQISESFAILTYRAHDKAILADIYTHAAHKPAWVTIVTLGPVNDQYGNTDPNGRYATATLDRGTAARFNWDNLTQDQAWAAYDIHLQAAFLDGH